LETYSCILLRNLWIDDKEEARNLWIGDKDETRSYMDKAKENANGE